MTPLAWGALAVLAAWGGITWLRRTRELRADDPVSGRIVRAPRGAAAPPPGDDDAIDYAALEEAEREVQELRGDAHGRPLEQEEGDDWGPGRPRPPAA